MRNDFRNKSWNFVDDFVLQPGPGCSVRHGSGINAMGFGCLSLPLLGTTWTLAVPTNSTTVSAHLEAFPPATSLYVVASKSGTTIETLSLFRSFWERSINEGAGQRFIAITDPGSSLADLAAEW